MAVVEKSLPGPVGEAAPFIGISLRLATGAANSRIQFQGSLGAEMSRAAPMAQLAAALGKHLDVPNGAVIIMYDGRTLDMMQNLEGNQVMLPGPAMRRAGAKVELFFDTVPEIVEDEFMRRSEEARQEDEERTRDVREQAMREKRERLRAEHEEVERQKILKLEVDLDEYIAQNVGVSHDRFQELLRDPEADDPKHFLRRCSEEDMASLQKIMKAREGHKAVSVLRAYENNNQILWERYRRAKASLRNGSIEMATSTTAGLCQGNPALAFLGDFEAAVNEYPLWHSTPSASAAGGICSTGFDIAFAGSAHATAWGHGFYFADDAGTSAGYAGHGRRVNAKYYGLKVMLLCRVLCGNLRRTSTAPTQEEKERLTAECLGPGGVFGAQSEYHCILGGGWAYVCAHRDQVYPQYVIIFQ